MICSHGRGQSNNKELIMSRHVLGVVVGLSILMVMCTINSHASGEFRGALSEVSIFEVDENNEPPLGAFNYSQTGQIFFFDASDSGDSDGEIVLYQWRFGENTIKDGITAEFAPSGTGPVAVTLTLIDDRGGVTLVQKSINVAATKETVSANVLHITFDDGQKSGQVFDEVSGAWIGSGADNAAISFGNEGGRFFVKHDGSSTAKITLPNSILSRMGTQFTIEAVMRQDSLGNLAAFNAVKYYAKGSSMSLKYSAAYIGANWDAGSTASVGLRSTDLVNTGQWYTVRYVVDLLTSTIKLFIDGLEVATKQDTANLIPLENDFALLDIVVGIEAESDFFLDDIKIWNTIEIP